MIDIPSPQCFPCRTVSSQITGQQVRVKLVLLLDIGPSCAWVPFYGWEQLVRWGREIEVLFISSQLKGKTGSLFPSWMWVCKWWLGKIISKRKYNPKSHPKERSFLIIQSSLFTQFSVLNIKQMPTHPLVRDALIIDVVCWAPSTALGTFSMLSKYLLKHQNDDGRNISVRRVARKASEKHSHDLQEILSYITLSFICRHKMMV